MSQKLKTAVVQHQGYEKREVCWEATSAGIKEASRSGAQLTLLQELHAGLYFCQAENPDAFQLAETIPGPTTNFLASLAKQWQMVIIGSVFERRGAGIYHNTAVVLERDGSIAGIYRKMHIPDDPGYYEKYYFAPGDLGCTPIQTSVGKLGVLICWDQWFPEAARLMALAGAELLLFPTAIGYTPEDPESMRIRLIDSWTTIQRAHSIANCLPVLSCNRVGYEKDPSGATKGQEFWGGSFITGTHGEILAQAGNDTAVLTSEIDLAEIDKTRHTWPYLRDRRIDAYAGLTKLSLDETN